jgi:molybdenum cofactor synthesis domain-containing protein
VTVPPHRTAAALVIGSELLTGKIEDQNLVVLARELRSLGVVLRRAVTVLDDLEVIAEEIVKLSREHDWVFTSGGVGPTHDDVTIDAVARAFGVDVLENPEMAGMLRDFYGDRLQDDHLRMARMPRGARIIKSVHLPWPTVVMRNVWVLPGVPQIFRMKMPVVRDELGSDRPFVSMCVLSTLDEGQLKAILDRVVDDFPDVQVGSYPRWSDPECKTKLTFDGTDPDRVRQAQMAFAAALPEGSVVRTEE